MARKKNRKLSKTEILTLFERGNYKRVVSKIKQFSIEGMDEDEIKEILVKSRLNMAQKSFEAGEIARALRDIESLLQIDNSPTHQLLKLKYLCYIEHFEDAIGLGEELLLFPKIKQDVAFLYIMAKLYSGEYEVDRKLLKLLAISKQRYILGFKALVEDNMELALDYFKQTNPRAKVEKENVKAIISLLENRDMELHSGIKPIYRFLLTGEEKDIPNTKNFRTIRDEIKRDLDSKKKNRDLKDILSLKRSVDISHILKNVKDKDIQVKLIYNNILLLTDRRKYIEALNIFFKYRHLLVNLIESASLLMSIRHENGKIRNSKKIILSFFISYLKIHHKKLFPHQIDYILLFLLNNADFNRGLSLAKKYDRDTFSIFLEEFFTAEEFSRDYQSKFNGKLRRYSPLVNIVLKLVIINLESLDKLLGSLPSKEKVKTFKRVDVSIKTLKNLDNIHRRYRNAIMGLLNAFAMLVQNFSYTENRDIYLELSNLIEDYIEYFQINRVELSIDTKALFVSISKKRSIKNMDFYHVDEDDYFNLTRILILGDEYEEEKYDFDLIEYDLLSVKDGVMKALENGDKEPFKELQNLQDYRYFRLKVPILLEILDRSMELGLDIDAILEELLSNLNMDITSSGYRNMLIKEVTSYAKINLELSIKFMEYILGRVEKKSREYVWYLKWIETYLSLIEKYNLKRGVLFENYREHFLVTQGRKKFKSLRSIYKKIERFGGRK
jgi:hypothetical protein